MATEDPFNDPAIQARIQDDVGRIEADWLEWNAEGSTGKFEDKIVERLVALLDAHARGYLNAVNAKARITEYLTRLREVGGVLVRTQREHGFLNNPYSEDRLRATAESAGKVIRLKLTGPPEAYAAALESEIEQTRAEVRKDAEQWIRWRSSMLFRIDLRFEARYRHWEAEAIEQVQRGTDPLIQNYEFCRAMKQTHANSEKINEDFFRQLVVETLRIPENEITPEQWLHARLTLMKEYGGVDFVPREAPLTDAPPLEPLLSTMPVAAEQSFVDMAKRMEEAVRQTQPGEDTKSESKAAEATARAAASGPTQSELASDTSPKAEPVSAQPSPEIVPNSGNGTDLRAAGADPLFPERAAWLNDRLRERSWNKHEVSRQGGPDHKTVQKIRDGARVREDVLDKLAKALSNAPDSKKLPKVSLLDIPQG